MRQLSNKVLKTDSPVNEFVHETVTDSSGREVVFVKNDLCVLFDQQRLLKFGRDTIDAILSEFAPTSSVNQKLRSDLSDEQLLTHIKSRHIQTQSDLLKYFQSLENDRSLLESEIEAAKMEVSPADSDPESLPAASE